jgi:hypothetical protein
LIISPYLILFLIIVIVLGGAEDTSGDMGQRLELAGRSPVVFGIPVLLDGLFHVLFMVTAVTLFAVCRLRWPVRASLILVGGAWQMITAFTKTLSALYIFPTLGAAYVAGDAALRAMLLPIAASEDGLIQALQQMDSLGVMSIWLLVSLLPAEAALPRPVRWLGWILTLAILSPDPAFLLVLLLAPVWLFLLGRWLKRLSAAQ